MPAARPVSLTSSGQPITGNYISSTGTGGNGGNLSTASSTLVLNGVDSSGNSINTSDTGSGNGGTVTITTTSPIVFTVGASSPISNGTAGNINSSGTVGGYISMLNSGNQTVNSGYSILANGTTGSGGAIYFQSQPGVASLNVIVNGTVQATNSANNAGNIGFNTGAGQNLNLVGSGTVNAGSTVYVGNIESTGNISNPFVFLSQPSGTVIIDKNLTVGNNVVTNGYIPPPPVPPSPVTPENSRSHYSD